MAKKTTVVEPEVTEPEVTEPEVTEPEVTEPEVTEEPKAEMVRAYKIHNDVQTSFCGVRVQADEHGKEYFLLPNYAKNLVDQHINLVWPAEEE